jgi:hypothetical protein
MRHSLLSTTIERISAAQVSAHLTDGEKLSNDLQAVEMIMNGNPSSTLLEWCDRRIRAIAHQLMDVRVEYPPALLAMRRAIFLKQVEAKIEDAAIMANAAPSSRNSER